MSSKERIAQWPIIVRICLAGRGDGHLPDTDLVVRVTSEKSLAISCPSHRQTLGWSSLGRVSRDLWFELFNHVLAFKIPDLDRWAGGGAQPVTVGREAQSVDGVGVVQGVQVFAIIEVPQHGFGILATGGTQRTIGRHGYSVQVASVALLLDSVFALGQGIPQLDGFISGSTDNLTIIGGEGHAQNIVAAIFKTPGGSAGRQIPQSQVLVPRSGQGEVSIRRQDNVWDEVSVSMKALLGDPVVLFITG